MLQDGTVLALAAGRSDTTAGRAMLPTDRMLQGSVGKTYVAAVAMQLVNEGLLDLDAKVSAYLDVQNVYNHWYPEVTVYANDWSQQASLIGLPIYPSLGVQVDY